MKILVDMNLSPSWVPVLVAAGHEAVHWVSIGSPTAPDRDILQWAKERQHVVFTHDLDFGAMLAVIEADSPSVIQMRTANPVPDFCRGLVLDVVQRYAGELVSGALISIDANKSRMRLLPLRRVRQIDMI